jgi:chaperone modulatory protein CbpM
LRFVCELKHDLNVNDDALPVILRLVDQVYELRHTLRNLARAVEAQPQSVRERIAKALRDTSRL